MSSLVHSITLKLDKTEIKVVLRQFNNVEWLRDEPDLPLHEAENLQLAEQAGINTPQIIAFDKTGSICGIPAVLMSQLDGTVILHPPFIEEWLDGLAQALAQIHAVAADHHPWKYFTYNDISALKAPSWSSHTDAWNKVISLVKGPRPQSQLSFIHRDYHPNPTNVLWSNNKVSGVVDWVNACLGPAGIDIGHCRLNLAQLYDVATADAFLHAYAKYAGPQFQYEPYWNLLSLIDILFGPPTVYSGWPAFGVTELTDALVAERSDSYMLSLVERAVIT